MCLELVKCIKESFMSAVGRTGMLTKYRTSRWGDSRVCRVHIISMSNQKWIYFVHINQNPMNSDPKYTISCRDPLLKHARNVINLFLEPKNEVYT